MSTPHEASPAEPTDSTSSWLTVVNSSPTVDHSGSSAKANVMRPPGNSVIRGAGDGPGDLRENPQGRPSHFTQHHPTYHHPHPANGETLPPHLPLYIPTGNNDLHDPNISGRPRSNSHNNTQIIHEGSYAHISDYPCAPSGFTPINQYGSLMGFPQQFYTSPYVQADGFVHAGPSNYEESEEQLDM